MKQDKINHISIVKQGVNQVPKYYLPMLWGGGGGGTIPTLNTDDKY